MSEKATILVVEDNDFIRAQIVSYLTGDAYNVLEATDGRAALDVVTQEGVDLTILDLRMEPMGGFDFIRMMQSKEIDLPVILVTGDDSADLLAQAGRLGVGSVLMKPVARDRLLQMVERVLSRAARSERRKP